MEVQQQRNLKEGAAENAARVAIISAHFGKCPQAKEDAARALAFNPRNVSSGWALAVCGDTAQRLADEIAKESPVFSRSINAAIEINRNNPAKAIQILQGDGQNGVGDLWPQYFRGLAYLKLGKGAEAAAEFQTMLDHRGWNFTFLLHPLAHLGLARAAALTGDTAKSRKAYEDFFALWKDADPDIPILQQAKQEYDKLK